MVVTRRSCCHPLYRAMHREKEKMTRRILFLCWLVAAIQEGVVSFQPSIRRSSYSRFGAGGVGGRPAAAKCMIAPAPSSRSSRASSSVAVATRRSMASASDEEKPPPVVGEQADKSVPASSLSSSSTKDGAAAKPTDDNDDDDNMSGGGLTRTLLLAIPLFCKFVLVLIVKFLTDVVVYPLLWLFRLARITKRKVLSLFVPTKNKKKDDDFSAPINGEAAAGSPPPPPPSSELAP